MLYLAEIPQQDRARLSTDSLIILDSKFSSELTFEGGGFEKHVVFVTRDGLVYTPKKRKKRDSQKTARYKICSVK